MKKNLSPFLLCLPAIVCMLFFQSGCNKDHSTRTFTIKKPIYKAKSIVLSEINGSAAQPIENAGKIYIKDKFIFLSEIDKGIHIINNSNPSRPVQIAFLNIPGNQDIAVKENILYADMYADLVAIDISDMQHVRMTKVVNNLFTDRIYTEDSNMVITGWIKKDTTVPVEAASQVYSNACANCYFNLDNSAASTTKSSATGTAGSMAKMTLIDNYLYAITGLYSVGVVNASNAAAPYIAKTVSAGFDLETIYPFENRLFLGSSIGMFMYDVSDPENPAKLGMFAHFRASDPVVTDGKYAYVTLHGGVSGSGFGNELEVIDIHDLMNPFLVKAYPMTKPGGLSKDGNLLFICDGASGVKMYNAGDPGNLRLSNTIESKEPYDVIAGNHIALVVAKNGIYQYDYSNPNNIRQLSVISVKN